MIKNIVFDMGGVLIRWKPAEILSQYGLSPEEAEILNRELFRSVAWMQQDRGILTGEEVAETVGARVPEPLRETVRSIACGWYHRYLIPIPGMAELARELKDNGYHIYLLSNASQALRSYFPGIPGSECFERLMVSAEEKLLKPSHEIYERLFDKFGLNGAECWFIDDSPATVEGAILTGMGGTVFHGDVARLRRELRRAGIRCRE